MISLKKYLEMERTEPGSAKAVPESNELALVILQSYRSALRAMGKSGARACPGVGTDLQQSLAGLEPGLCGDLTPTLIAQTEARVEELLQQWGGRSEDYFKAKAKEVKELLIMLAHTAQSVGERDQRYTNQFTEFTTRLRTIANLEDLTQIRTSLVQRASELKNYVDRMAEDSKNSVAQLRAEVSTYETRLKAVEELALRDAMTGLANRRNIEERIEARIAQQQTFCVVMLDLNRLKKVNDTHGHLAGDSLLKQFAQELRSNLSSSGTAGRWGGDEFIVVLDCDLATANGLIDRVRKWVFGDYTLKPGAAKGDVKVFVDASVGTAQWHPGETMQEVIEHADSAMYREKQTTKKKAAAAGR
ncbi:MAG TPA: GGDEF domain-containing protein [Terriglobales bacterium]|nr:GGDEF domain-containing protein [Terriglobales bacterium]